VISFFLSHAASTSGLAAWRTLKRLTHAGGAVNGTHRSVSRSFHQPGELARSPEKPRAVSSLSRRPALARVAILFRIGILPARSTAVTRCRRDGRSKRSITYRVHRRRDASIAAAARKVGVVQQIEHRRRELSGYFEAMHRRFLRTSRPDGERDVERVAFGANAWVFA
jgi:hypothetical protein